MSAAAKCGGCTSDLGWPDDGRKPAVSRCGTCPPVQCEKCGETDTPHNPCSCWVSTRGMAMADLKAMFALSDLSLGRATEGLPS